MASSPKATVVLGKGDLAIRVAEWFRASPSHTLLSIVPVMPEPVWTGSFASWASSVGVPVVSSGDYRDLSPGTIDLAFSIFYDKLLPGQFIDRCSQVLNLHNGPLPRYRGVAPINWALKNGETHHGVTIHEITPGIDDGPVVAQVTYSIYPDHDEVRDVYERSLAYGYTLFEQTMPILDRITPQPQDEAMALYYSAADQAKLGDRRSFTRGESVASEA